MAFLVRNSHILETQGLKLRSLASKSGSSTEKKKLMRWWPSPTSPSQATLLRCWTFTPTEVDPSAPRHLRMVSVPCNGPDVTGYSVCWSHNLMFIHTHRAGEKDLSFYKDSGVPAHAVWIYMPIEPDERLLDIWGRRGKSYMHSGLVVRPAWTLHLDNAPR